MHFYEFVQTCLIPGTGEPGGLPSVGSHRVGHDWSDLVAAAAAAAEAVYVQWFYCSKFKRSQPSKQMCIYKGIYLD